MRVSSTTLPDPPLPVNGNCASCGQPRDVKAKGLHRAEAARDPFCSTECAKLYFGVRISTPLADSRLGYMSEWDTTHKHRPKQKMLP